MRKASRTVTDRAVLYRSGRKRVGSLDANILFGAGVAGYVGGGALMMGSILGHDPEASLNMTPIYIGAGVMSAGLATLTTA